MESHFYLLGNMFNSSLFKEFLTEADSLRSSAPLHEVKLPRIEERGGKPMRKFKSIGGGPVQTKIYQSDQLINAIFQYTGNKLVPTGQRGTYIFYQSKNDFLDIHRDINTCDMTLITCLQSNVSDHDAHGHLYLYVNRANESLGTIYQNRNWGYLTVNLKQGESILIKGGIVPHGINPLKSNQYRAISAMCFRKN